MLIFVIDLNKINRNYKFTQNSIIILLLTLYM